MKEAGRKRARDALSQKTGEGEKRGRDPNEIARKADLVRDGLDILRAHLLLDVVLLQQPPCLCVWVNIRGRSLDGKLGGVFGWRVRVSGFHT